MKTLSLIFVRVPGGEVGPGWKADLGVRRLTMRRGTNSSGPGGLTRRALRIGVLAGLAVGLILVAGLPQGQAQLRGRGSFGGGWHGGPAISGFGPRSGGAGFQRGVGGQGGFKGWQQQRTENRSQPSPRPAPRAQNRGRQNPGPVNRGRTNRDRGNVQRRSMPQGRGNPQGPRSSGRFNNNRLRGARPGQMQPGNRPQPAMRQGPNGPGSFRQRYNPQPNMGRNLPGMRPGAGGAGYRPGQEHLPAWWRAHRNLSPQQQADAMRREPGFRNLPRAQQQRLLGRLRSFDSRPPQVQQRMLSRVEMFERLSPERQQEVRGASAAFNHMPQQRKQEMIRAFQQLRHMPPAERQQMLQSSYGQQFSPRERTILGNLLSIEPYAPSSSEPYFGRPH